MEYVTIVLIVLILILLVKYLVKSNKTETIHEFHMRLFARYKNLTDDQLRTEVIKSMKVLEGLMNTAIKKCNNDNLHLVAHYYKKVLIAAYQRLPSDNQAFNNLSPDSRHKDLISMAVSVHNFRAAGVSAAARRAGRTLRVTDTEESLLKKFKNVNHELLALVKKSIEIQRQSNRVFLVDFHIWLYDFIVELQTQFEDDLNKENSSDIRTKNLQQMLNDLTLVFVLEGGDPGDSEEIFPNWSRLSASISELIFKLQLSFS